MSTLRLVLTILYIIDCVFLLVVVLMQEGKSQGLGAIGGGNESYWSKNKARSKEGKLVMVKTVSAVLFMVFSVLLNLNLF